MVETRLKWFEHLERRHMDYVERRVDKMTGCQITRGRETPRKIRKETITNNLEINELDKYMILDRTL